MKLVGKLFAVLVLSGATYFAVIEQPTFATGGCGNGNNCQRAQCTRRKCRITCTGQFDCLDRCDQAFLSNPAVDLDCYNGRDTDPIIP